MELKDIRIVLVSPESDFNLGFAARAIKNMGFSELWLVNPKANRHSLEARKYAKHAQDILAAAKVVKSLAGATKGVDLAVGTTGILRRGKQSLRNPISLGSFAELAKKRKGKIALLIGRESIGLKEKEIRACDLVVTIPANPDYPVMNISHALAVALYTLRQALAESSPSSEVFTLASETKRREIYKSFAAFISFYKPSLRNPAKIGLSMKRFVGRALITDLEASALLGILKKAEADLKRAKRNIKENKK